MFYITISVDQSKKFRPLLGSSGIRENVRIAQTEQTYVHVKKYIKCIKDGQFTVGDFDVDPLSIAN